MAAPRRAGARVRSCGCGCARHLLCRRKWLIAAADAAHPTSAHGRSTATAHAAPAHGATTAAHGAHGDEDEQPLGPVDVELWGAGVLATVIGLFMAICFVLATAGTGAY